MVRESNFLVLRTAIDDKQADEDCTDCAAGDERNKEQYPRPTWHALPKRPPKNPGSEKLQDDIGEHCACSTRCEDDAEPLPGTVGEEHGAF